MTAQIIDFQQKRDEKRRKQIEAEISAQELQLLTMTQEQLNQLNLRLTQQIMQDADEVLPISPGDTTITVLIDGMHYTINNPNIYTETKE